MRRADLDDFVAPYLPGKTRDERTEPERWRSFTCDEPIARDKVNLDVHRAARRIRGSDAGAIAGQRLGRALQLKRRRDHALDAVWTVF